MRSTIGGFSEDVESEIDPEGLVQPGPRFALSGCQQAGEVAGMVERSGDLGFREGPFGLVVVLPSRDAGLRGRQVALDLVCGCGGEVRIHAGPDGGEDSVELERQIT